MIISVLGLLSAFSSNARVAGQTPLIIDTSGVDMNRYQADLADCKEYAQQVPVGEKAAAGSAKGAVVGGGLGPFLKTVKARDIWAGAQPS